MTDYGGQQQFSTPSTAADIFGTRLMIAAVIFLFVVLVFVLCLYLYTKYYTGAQYPSLRRGSSGRFLFPSPDDLVHVPVPHRGLDVDILSSLPIAAYRVPDFEGGGLECSVCLSEVSEGEGVRLLPGCGHGFHVGCIDMWFHSHSTCPLCRSLVEMPAVGGGGEGNLRVLAIDIPPRRAMEGFLPSPTSSLPTSRFSGEDAVSPEAKTRPATPRSGRLRSFRRLLNGGKWAVGSSCSPRGGDIEQGAVAVVGCCAVGEGSSSSIIVGTKSYVDMETAR